MTPKLRVWRTAFETYAVILKNLGFLARTGWMWILLTTVLLAALDWSYNRNGRPGAQSVHSLMDVGYGLAQSLVLAACLAGLAVAWHRRILNSNTENAGSLTPLAKRYGLTAFLTSAAVALLLELPIVGTSAFSRSGGASAAMAAVSLVALYVLSRISLVLPAVAIETDASLDAAWRATQGNGWRLAGGVLVVTVLPCLIIVLMLTAVGFSLADIGRADVPAELMTSIYAMVLGVLTALIAIGFLSVAYRNLVLKRAEEIPAAA